MGADAPLWRGRPAEAPMCSRGIGAGRQTHFSARHTRVSCALKQSAIIRGRCSAMISASPWTAPLPKWWSPRRRIWRPSTLRGGRQARPQQRRVRRPPRLSRSVPARPLPRHPRRQNSCATACGRRSCAGEFERVGGCCVFGGRFTYIGRGVKAHDGPRPMRCEGPFEVVVIAEIAPFQRSPFDRPLMAALRRAPVSFTSMWTTTGRFSWCWVAIV